VNATAVLTNVAVPGFKLWTLRQGNLFTLTVRQPRPPPVLPLPAPIAAARARTCVCAGKGDCVWGHDDGQVRTAGARYRRCHRARDD
jgi:hypothetical protein